MEIKIISSKYGEIITIIDKEDYKKIKGLNLYITCVPSSKKIYIMTYIKDEFVNILKYKSNERRTSLHRLIMGFPEGKEVDHINGDTLDNRKSNLRICTKQQNTMNSRKRNNATSKYKGVFIKYRGKFSIGWVSRIRYNNKLIRLGYFHNEIEAARAYNCAARILFGEYACLNNIEKKYNDYDLADWFWLSPKRIIHARHQKINSHTACGRNWDGWLYITKDDLHKYKKCKSCYNAYNK